MDSENKIHANEVIAKLKDDGDFDRLRLKIVRQLKDNEDLRNSIIEMVKQSAPLNRSGAVNLKPRQLSDAIHEEVGDKVMNQISSVVWEIIGSENGMRNEITETVQSVYKKLSNPQAREECQSSNPFGQTPAEVEGHCNGETDDALSDNEPKEPPGFSLSNHHRKSEEKDKIHQIVPHETGPSGKQKEGPNVTQDLVELIDVDHILPCGFTAVKKQEQPSHCSEEDPDVPPGFG